MRNIFEIFKNMLLGDSSVVEEDTGVKNISELNYVDDYSYDIFAEINKLNNWDFSSLTYKDIIYFMDRLGVKKLPGVMCNTERLGYINGELLCKGVCSLQLESLFLFLSDIGLPLKDDVETEYEDEDEE